MTRIICQAKRLLPLLLAAVLLLPAIAYAEETPAPESVQPSERLATEREAAYLTDGDLASRIRIAAGSAFIWELPAGTEALRLLWHDAPRKATVYALDAAGQPFDDTYSANGAYETVLTLAEDAAAIRIDVSAEDAILSEIETITADAAAAMAWQTPERVDTLIIAAHTGDEAAIFSGLIPSISAAGRTSMTVFISAKSREARQDALDTARAYLQPYEPQFLGQKYLLIAESQKERTYKIWPENTLVEELTALIRRYRPAVVVSHAPAGEDGEGMHRMIARVAEQAVADAANARRERDSLKAYGTHTVAKLYLHGEPEPEKPRKYSRATPAPVPPASVVLDYTANPAEGFLGKTAQQVAQTATDAYRSIRVLHRTVEPVGKYWLIRSEVGADSGKNDLFEHIDAAALSEGVILLPTATPAPTVEPMAVTIPTPAPAPVPTEAVQTEAPAMQTETPLVTVGILLAAAIALSVLLGKVVSKKIEKRAILIPVILLPVLLAAAISAVLLLRPAEVAATTVEPAPLPTPTATPAPTETPTPAPEATLSPEERKALDWAAYFRSEDDPEEVVVFDEENGRWEYRSDTLSVLIERREKPELPLVWYVAHIRMLEDAFRPGFGSLDEAGSAKLEPWRLARRAKAVLAITGDNLINDEVWRKGRLIRNGILYGEGDAQPTLALCPDMTLRIYEIGTPAEEILFAGVENTYGFGPVLVRDGEIAQEECLSHRVKNDNPRAGIGMVEPGHYVAIVVDGRQPAHSIGATLLEYAAMFVEEGCTLAYNMDGGISSGMIFMGEGIHQHRSSKSKKSSGQRPWADALLFGCSDLVPSEDDPVYSTGNLDEKKARGDETP